jgi:hypothetical protein
VTGAFWRNQSPALIGFKGDVRPEHSYAAASQRHRMGLAQFTRRPIKAFAASQFPEDP